ncbi:capsule assembly protein Wzi [Dyadobacter jejuensis]|uniref:Capsule assembly protein Wzi n=1 Tax=Dyadobacter jejuensis TaxID=1082580 RepID=A0A316BD27_9BACT|nr:capsule assembly Wzi family protein [Dyadobacter jejuensis]PWJ60377.1 capsule assembly protein Wzi [Dyadobacter jejuensis]
MKTHYFFCTLLSVFISFQALCQNLVPNIYDKADSSFASVEIYGLSSSNNITPFWLHANQYGIIPKDSPTGALKVSIQKFWPAASTTNEPRKFRVGIGAEVVGNRSQNNEILLPQAYVAMRYKGWELSVGRKKQNVGLADSTLGMGSYAWSGNAMPLPKIQLGTMGFIDVPFTKGWLAFNAFYSDGFFEKNRPYTSDLLFHQKALYLRIGNQNSRLKLIGGINHQVQWSGYSPYETINGKMPSGIKNYFRAVTGKLYPVGEELTPFDYENRVGNHLGTIDFGLQYLGFNYHWFFYRQNIYEDGSLFTLNNLADGLNGVTIKKQNSYGSNFEINQITLEYLYTKSQGGSQWDRTIILGRDNYFNHAQVRDGYSYFNRTIGTPFIPPSSDTEWRWPAYWFTANNRVAALHLGLQGSVFQKVLWMSKLSVSNNSGIYDVPFEGNPKQFSGILSLQTHLSILGGSTLKGSVAADMGDLYRKSVGFSLGLRKDFNL